MARKQPDPKGKPADFYREEQWGEPMDSVIAVRINGKMKELLAKQAYKESVDLSTLCRRYLLVGAAEQEINLLTA